MHRYIVYCPWVKFCIWAWTLHSSLTAWPCLVQSIIPFTHSVTARFSSCPQSWLTKLAQQISGRWVTHYQLPICWQEMGCCGLLCLLRSFINGREKSTNKDHLCVRFLVCLHEKQKVCGQDYVFLFIPSVITTSIIVGRNSYVTSWNEVFGGHKDNCQCNLTTQLVML